MYAVLLLAWWCAFCLGYTPKGASANTASKVAAALARSGKTWTDAEGNCISVSTLGDHTDQTRDVSVVSYNILGPLHGESSKHDYAPVSVTKWTRRREKLLDELRALNADILCLQEVSSKALRETLIPGLRLAGLECSGYAPTRVGHESKGRFGHKSVGCAVFTRTAKIAVLSSKRVHLRDFAPLTGCCSHEFHSDVVSLSHSLALLHVRLRGAGEETLTVQPSTGEDQGQGKGESEGEGEEGEEQGEDSAHGEGDIVALASSRPATSTATSTATATVSASASPMIPGDGTFIVGNTHLYLDPARPDLKAIQTAACVHALHAFATERGWTGADAAAAAACPPLLLVGDLNSMPDLPFDYDAASDGAGAAGAGSGDSSFSLSLPSAPFALMQSGCLEPSHPQHPDQWCLQLSSRDRFGRDSTSDRDKAEGPRFRSLQNQQHSTATDSSSSSSPSASLSYVSPRLGPIRVPYRLSNAYTLPPFASQAPLLTTKTDDFQGWIDHVLVGAGVGAVSASAPESQPQSQPQHKHQLEVTHVLTTPIARASLTAGLDARAFPPMPNLSRPSDHLPVGAVVRVSVARKS